MWAHAVVNVGFHRPVDADFIGGREDVRVPICSDLVGKEGCKQYFLRCE